MAECIKIEGILRIYEIPDELINDVSFQAGWARFTLAEKAREARQVVEAHNLITTFGRTQILNFIGASGTTTAFAKYYAVGTGTIFKVDASDPQLTNEIFRAVPASYSVIGSQVTITTNFTSSQANASYTEAGIFGGSSASGTANSGSLFTHLLYNYTKTNLSGITSDYVISLT